MQSYYVVGFVLMLIGIAISFRFSFVDSWKSFRKSPIFLKIRSVVFKKKQLTLYETKKEEEEKKKPNFFKKEYDRIKNALYSMGKASMFRTVLNVSIALIPVGCVISLLIGNVFLMPVMAFGLAVIPFAYASKIIADYDRQLKKELETSLSVITSSYIRNDDIVTAVSENLGYLKAPVKSLFENFVFEIRFVNPDIEAAIKKLKVKVKDGIFEDWCNTLILCQSDRALKDTLLPIVARYTDVRIVNNDLRGMMKAVKTEYLSMVGLLVANLPILKLLNPDWYDALINTTPGKIAMFVSAIAIIVTAGMMAGYLKPLEPGRRL